MEVSIFIARVLGLVFLLASSSMFLRREMVMDIFYTFFSARIFSYIFGFALFSFGVSVVIFHNVWSGDFYEVIITILGWTAVFESLAYVFLPRSFFKDTAKLVKDNNLFYALATIYLVLGSYLAYFGFLA